MATFRNTCTRERTTTRGVTNAQFCPNFFFQFFYILVYIFAFYFFKSMDKNQHVTRFVVVFACFLKQFSHNCFSGNCENGNFGTVQDVTIVRFGTC
jgi:hypothetical protein